MPSAYSLAKQDSSCRLSARGITRFLVNNGCALCSVQMGKWMTKENRKEHERSRAHLENFEQYKAHFTALRDHFLAGYTEHAKTLQLKQAHDRVFLLGRVIDNDLNYPRDPFGAEARGADIAGWRLHGTLSITDWLRTSGDLSGLKVALCDLLFCKDRIHDTDDDPVTHTVAAFHRHVHYARAILCHQLAIRTLPNDPDGAHVVAQLVIAQIGTQTSSAQIPTAALE